MSDIKNKINFQDNIGGIRSLYYFGLKNLTKGLFISTSGIFNIDLFDSENAEFAANLFKIDFQTESAIFKQESADIESGIIFRQSIDCIVSKDYVERTAEFAEMLNDRFLVFAFDSNNQSRIIGQAFFDGTHNGAKLTLSNDTGDAYDSSNYYKLSFYCETTAPAPSLGSEGNSFFSLPAPDTLD